MKRDFKGIWIPKEVWLSKDLTLIEKLFFVEINSLDNEDGCFAGNVYFSEFFGLSKTRVSVIIASLKEKGYITSTIIYKGGTKQILKRVLKICYIGYITKVKEPIKEKFIDSNTINNTVNNTINKREAVFKKNLTTFSNTYTSDLLENFFDYWSEKNKSGKKMKFELQKTFETSKRLATWFKRQEKWKKEKVSVKKKKTAAEEWRELLDTKKESSTFDNIINTNNE